MRVEPPATGRTVWTEHGFWRMSPGGRSLVHADGAPALLVADTAWALPWRATEEQVRTYAADRSGKGFNAALVMTVQPDMGVTGPRDRTADEGFGVAFDDLPEGRLERLDPAYFRYLDRLVAILVEHGIAPVLQPVFHGFGWKGKGTAGRVVPPQDYARYCRYLVARYGARPAVYPVGADGAGTEPQIAAGGAEVEAWDAYRQPTGIHYRPHAVNRASQDADWLDFQWCQTGHTGEHGPERVADMWRNEPGSRRRQRGADLPRLRGGRRTVADLRRSGPAAPLPCDRSPDRCGDRRGRARAPDRPGSGRVRSAAGPPALRRRGPGLASPRGGGGGPMRAAFVPGPGRIEVGDFPVPVARVAGELVVRMERASICGSDVHAVFHGFHNTERLWMPGYPGHEGVGVVVESRSARFPAGVRVLTVPLGDLGGCFAEYQLLDDDHVVPLPPDGDPARLLMAQQYGTTLYSMRMFTPLPGTATAAIIGAGSAGLFFLQQAVRLGFEHVVVSDLDERRLAVACRLGAGTLVHAPEESLVDAVMDVTGGAGADLVVEAAGYDALRADAVAAVAVRGTVGFFGFPERYGMAQFPMFEAFRKLVRIQWAGGAQSEPGLVAFRDALRDIHEGRIEVDYCLDPVHTLDDLPRALQIAREQGNGAVKLSIDLVEEDG